jgi:hypothetical protein
MSNATFLRLRDFVEPAHPYVIRFQDDLIRIYTLIRDRYQRRIDEAFTDVARRTGFVITSTLPVVFKVDEETVQMEMGAENLIGTLFESAMVEVLKPISDDLTGKLAVGEYQLYLIWYDALKLKLRTDWMEPAHWRRAEQISMVQVKPGWGVREPAHWFDSRLEIDLRDALVINAIDQVYPDLKLMDRVAVARGTSISAEAARKIGPGIHEPAHFRKLLQELNPGVLDQFIAALQEYQRAR